MTDQSLHLKQSQELEKAQAEIALLHKVRDATLSIASKPNLDELLSVLLSILLESAGGRQILVLMMDHDTIHLKVQAASQYPQQQKERIENLYINTFNQPDNPVIAAWLNNTAHTIKAEDSETSIAELLKLFGINRLHTVPMICQNHLVGVVGIEMIAEAPPTQEDSQFLLLFLESVAMLIDNARLHTDTVEQLADNMAEMSMMAQIDRELNETIALPTVFNMTLDWVLRFTMSHAAHIALYDEATDTLRTMLNYGYQMSDEELEDLRVQSDNTISHRVARSGRVEVLPDIMLDKDYAWGLINVKSQMAVPVMREDQVIAVVTLESTKINAFTDEHVEFVQKLANRAGVAIDNARLYDETVREREKLSHILGSVGDIVIVIDREGRLLLISTSAIYTLGLHSNENYIGRPFTETITFDPLLQMYNRAHQIQDGFDDELELPNNRIYFTNIQSHIGIGEIIVMQDITPFKEMDRLKSELIATVSHDLKQPLGVMRGYLDLLQMTNQFDEKSTNFITMIDRAIVNMRQLIDDLLDLARIESGMDLKFERVGLHELLSECIKANEGSAQAKHMAIIQKIPDKLPVVEGERFRLHQIFNNLISNAIKYTPLEGTVTISAESRSSTVRIGIKDNGIGISPEDQPHIFDRFYRVRGTETESIDGTGLGLAIVKTLVEAHRGKIRLESELGEGTTFYVTLPAVDA